VKSLTIDVRFLTVLSSLCFFQGADATTGAPALFNIVELSFNDPSKTFLNTGMREPQEAQVTPVLGPKFAINTQTFTSISDFSDFVNAHFAAATPPEGSNGIYGESFKEVMQSYFLKCPNHPTAWPQIVRCDSLSISSASRSLVELTLPFDPITNKYTFTLDKWAERAIQSLPPPSVYSNISSWWGTYHPLFYSFFEKYGTDVIVSASLGGMVEQYSSFDKVLETQLGKDALLRDAKIDFNNATGVGGQTGAVDKKYIRQLNPITCVGGDNPLCTKSGISAGTWGSSTEALPALLQYKIVPLVELLSDYDPGIKKSLEAGAEQYVAEGQKRWQDYYSKYLRCEPPFKYPNDPEHCKVPPTPAPTLPCCSKSMKTCCCQTSCGGICTRPSLCGPRPSGGQCSCAVRCQQLPSWHTCNCGC
jgi:hypothetical protein